MLWDNTKDISLVQGWHNLQLFLTSEFDPRRFPQSTYVEIFATFATKMLLIEFLRQKRLISTYVTKKQCFHILRPTEDSLRPAEDSPADLLILKNSVDQKKS